MSRAASKNIHFHYMLPGIRLPERTRLKSFISMIFILEKYRVGEIHVIFCDSRTLRELNKKHLHHDYPTDILTFDLSDPGTPVRADIFISVRQVAINARRFHSSKKHELHRVIIHGVLHLCGYLDGTPQEKQEMREKEDFYLGRYF